MGLGRLLTIDYEVYRCLTVDVAHICLVFGAKVGTPF